jgi:hypothetical protein
MSKTADTAPDISYLCASALDATPRHLDLERYGQSWEYTEAAECSECGAKMLTEGGEQQHKDIEEDSTCEGYVSGDGPMMNYLYALPTTPDEAEIRDALADLPLCVVTLTDAIDGEDTFLALTGGGMDMSWYIVKAYVRLGYLPPAYFDLPAFAGMRLTDEKRLLIEACRETQRAMAARATRSLSRLDALERDLRARSTAA